MRGLQPLTLRVILDALQNRHIITELQLQQLQSEHEMLQRDYDALLDQMRAGAASKVTPIAKKGQQ
jgi:hypothetical protein